MNDGKNKLFESLKSLSNNPTQLAKLSESIEEVAQKESLYTDEMDIPYEPIDIFSGEKNTEKDNKKSSYKKAFDYAIRILSLRDYSTYKMKQKLKEKGFSTEHSTEVIEKLLEYKYIRDEEYTQMRTKQLILKGYANSFILRKLQQEHLISDNELIESLRSEQGLESDSQLRSLIEKKLRNKEIPKEFSAKMKLKNKVTAFLASKGYNFDQINSALKDYIS